MWCIQNHRITYYFKKFLTTSVLILNFVYLVICETKLGLYWTCADNGWRYEGKSVRALLNE